MIVCHCEGITDHDIRAAVGWMRAADPDTVITPGKVYHALGRRADCGGCMPVFLDTMRCAEGFRVPGREDGRQDGRDGGRGAVPVLRQRRLALATK